MNPEKRPEQNLPLPEKREGNEAIVFDPKEPLNNPDFLMFLEGYKDFSKRTVEADPKPGDLPERMEREAKGAEDPERDPLLEDASGQEKDAELLPAKESLDLAGKKMIDMDLAKKTLLREEIRKEMAEQDKLIGIYLDGKGWR